MNVENAVLGLCMRDKENLSKVLGVGIGPEMFLEHPDIFQAVVESDAIGEGVGLEEVAPRVPPSKLTALVNIYENAPITQRVEYWAEELKVAYWSRSAAKGVALALIGLRQRKPFQEISSIREAILNAVEGYSDSVKKTEDSRSLMMDVIDEIEKLAEGGEDYVPSGLKPIERLMGGFHKGDLVVIAARPGVGKTTLGLQFAREAASRGHHTLFFTIEMTPKQVMFKALSAASNVNSMKLRSPRHMTDDDMDCIITAGDKIAKWPLYINNGAARDISALEVEAKALYRQGKLNLMVVDYIQLMKAPGSWRGNRVAEITEITGRLKALALELEIPIIALAQINREAARGNGLPGPHHLKDSGSIEQDADAIMILHKEEQESGDEKHWLFIAKNRHGSTGKFEVVADLAVNKFNYCDI